MMKEYNRAEKYGEDTNPNLDEVFNSDPPN